MDVLADVATAIARCDGNQAAAAVLQELAAAVDAAPGERQTHNRKQEYYRKAADLGLRLIRTNDPALEEFSLVVYEPYTSPWLSDSVKDAEGRVVSGTFDEVARFIDTLKGSKAKKAEVRS